MLCSRVRERSVVAFSRTFLYDICMTSKLHSWRLLFPLPEQAKSTPAFIDFMRIQPSLGMSKVNAQLRVLDCFDTIVCVIRHV